MKRLIFVLLAFSVSLFVGACSNPPAAEESPANDGAVLNADSSQPDTPAEPVAPPAAAPVAAPVSRPAAPKAEAPPVARTTEIPAGTAISILLIDSLSSEKNQAGDEFMASLSDPLMVGGKLVADKGTKVRGRIVDAVGAGRVKGLASLSLVLTGIMDGEKSIPIVTEALVTEAEATKGRDAAVVAGAAGVGAAIGAIAGGKKGAGIGTLIGAGSGTGAVLATKGNEVEFGSETKLKFTLQRTANLPTITRKIS
jgi:hypothetical protein